MIIEHIFEFESSGRGPSTLLQLAIFVTKQKFLRKILLWIIIYC